MQGEPIASSARQVGAERLAIAALLALLAAAWWATAWVCDDAFITLRTVDNALEGYGLVWNVDERVQAYTHPLWLLLLLAPSAVLGDPYVAALAVGAVCTLGTVALLIRPIGVTPAGTGAAIAGLIGSRAFVDYSSSGLENPLVHLLLAALVVACVRRSADERTQLGRGLLATLLLLARLDLAFAIAPLLLTTWWRDGLPRLRTLALAALPLLIWEAFSLVYYGDWIANSARAKLAAGVPLAERLTQGMAYLGATVRWDPISAVLLVAGPALAFAVGDPLARPLGMAIAAHLAWVVWVGGDFMAGRFLTPALLLAAVLVARCPWPRRLGWPVSAGLVLAVLASPYLSPFAVRDYGKAWHAPIDANGVADERRFHLESTALGSVLESGGWRTPEQRAEATRLRHLYARDPWIGALTSVGVLDERGEWPPPAAGEAVGDWTPVLVKGGVGLLAYRMGPGVVMIDYHGLGDPLLSRLPALEHDPVLARLIPRLAHLDWRVGHYLRPVPSGYVLSRATGENRLRDPDLNALYEVIEEVVSGPLGSVQRARAIVRLHSSWARERVARYVAGAAAYRRYREPGSAPMAEEASPVSPREGRPNGLSARSDGR